MNNVLILSLLLLNMAPVNDTEVKVIRDVVYSRATGYWSENHLRENDFLAQAGMLSNTLKEQELELTMDIFLPSDSDKRKVSRPLVMLMHGGAFFANSKESLPVSEICRVLAESGCVAASINYRMGYRINKKSVQEAKERALQDAAAALAFLIDHAEEYGADRNLLFIGGASSGAITTLRLAASENCPPIKGIIDMWGGMERPEDLDRSDAALLAFHGDQDKTVPYEEGYPLGGKSLMGYMYGSKRLVERRDSLGKQAKLITFEGYAHAPYREKDYSTNDNLKVILIYTMTFIRSFII